MTRDEIISAAKTAGFFFYDLHDVAGEDLGEAVEADDFAALERFAALATAELRAALTDLISATELHHRSPFDTDCHSHYNVAKSRAQRALGL